MNSEARKPLSNEELPPNMGMAIRHPVFESLGAV
jgi:hypothetical protein